MSAAAIRKFYLDTNVVIAIVEGREDLRVQVECLFEAIGAQQALAITSQLTWAESLVLPLRNHDTTLKNRFDGLFCELTGLEVKPVDLGVLMTAAQLRADLGVKMPDAIHLATALMTGCEGVLSEDRRMPSLPNLPVQPLHGWRFT